MEPFSWGQLILLLGGGTGLISLAIQVVKIVQDRLDKKRSEHQSAMQQHASESAELARINLEGMEFNKSTFVEFITMLKKDLAEKELEIQELRKQLAATQAELEVTKKLLEKVELDLKTLRRD